MGADGEREHPWVRKNTGKHRGLEIQHLAEHPRRLRAEAAQTSAVRKQTAAFARGGLRVNLAVQIVRVLTGAQESFVLYRTLPRPQSSWAYPRGRPILTGGQC